MADRALVYSSVLVDDDGTNGTSGNGNGQLNPGEVVDLSVYLRNWGSVTASGITATIASGNPHVTPVLAEAVYPSLAGGDSAQGSVPFRLNVSPLLQDGEAVPLTLTINATGWPAVGTIFLPVSGARLNYGGHTLSAALDPGASVSLSVTLRNSGPLPLEGVTATLVSRSPFIVVEDAAASYGTIASGAEVADTLDRFAVHADPRTYRGHLAPMLLVVHSNTGWSDSVQFTLTVGTRTVTDPTGPDAFGYFAYDNLDTAYTQHPDGNYFNISAEWGTNLNLNDGGEQNAVTQVYTAVRRLPFAFKFYDQVYDTITVCSNGWCAFGAQGWNGAFRNYPIPAQQAPQAMIAPYWQDLCTSGTNTGVWTYFQPNSHRFVVQWKAAQMSSSGACNGQSLDFEVILYDTAFYPTRDGNGKVLVQYAAVTATPTDISSEIPGFSAGIQDQRGLIGLGYYAHIPGYAPGAAALTAGRAILFTTEATTITGSIQGRVLDAATAAPIANATISSQDFPDSAVTDAEGYYLLPFVPAGVHWLHASSPGYDPADTSGIPVREDSNTVVNFSLTETIIAGTIAGRVLDAAMAAPLAGATILSPDFPDSAVTDAAGYYHLLLVPTGVYHLRAVHAGFYPVDTSGIRVGMDSTTIVDFNLSVISGTGGETPVVPATYRLYQNYPNPFNPVTEIRFDLPQAEWVELKIFNLLGQEVAALLQERKPAGTYRISWDNRSVPGLPVSNGVYIYRLKAGRFVRSRGR